MKNNNKCEGDFDNEKADQLKITRLNTTRIETKISNKNID